MPVKFVLLNSISLVECTVACLVSNLPSAVYLASADVLTSLARLEFVLLSVNLNTLVPVLHLGFESTVESGIANVPDTAPLASVIKEPPSDPPLGVT